MTEEVFNAKLKKIEAKNEELRQKQLLKIEKQKYKTKPNIKLPPTSKIVLLVAAIFCAQIVIFSEYAILKLGSGEALYTLIGAPIAIVPIVISYYGKSKAENTKDGLVYDSAMAQLGNEDLYEEWDEEELDE